MNVPALSTRRRRSSRVLSPSPEPLLQKTFHVYVERSFRIERLIEDTARDVGLPRWRLLSDERRFLKPGDVTFELTATRSQIEAFEKQWVTTLQILGETEL